MSARISHRTRLVYVGLMVLWILVLAWQTLEHRRVRRTARAELVNRARDISGTAALIIRSQRRFGGLISKDRLESALTSLIRPGELNSIALLNNAEQVVASAGAPVDFDLGRLVPSAEYWAGRTVALMNLVDLGGTNVTDDPDSRNATIVLPRSDLPPPFGTNRPSGRGDDRMMLPPPPPESIDHRPPPREETDGPSAPRPGLAGSGPPPPEGTNDPARQRGRFRRGDGRFPFGRPFWMSEEEYRALLQKQGVHSFVLVLSTDTMHAAASQDLWVRCLVGAFATVSVIGFGLAWSNLARSSDLEVRLARAAELNARLKEMNLAAAGLAHETRNPLNIIRGLAQILSKQDDTAPQVQSKVRDIIAETDRVTAQLNEFINYSRPREVRWSQVHLGHVTSEVVRTLGSDLEERSIQIRVAPDLPVIRGDEPLLRQALFNLLLNAVQAVERGGDIEVAGLRIAPSHYQLEIRDHGTGVAPEHRAEIFKPYFTTHEEGTGLGLAIVQQIVLAHGWEIDCLPNQPRGAIFRIRHIELANPRSPSGS